MLAKMFLYESSFQLNARVLCDLVAATCTHNRDEG
jgi:hypothetical protein